MRKDNPMSMRMAGPACLGFTRRQQLAGALPAFAVFALLGEACAATRTPRRGGAEQWITRQKEIAEVLARGEIRPGQWMVEVERLAKEVDIAELMAAINRSRITPAGEPFHNDPRKRFVRFVDDSGEPRRMPFGAALFDFSPANVVTPHGHKHMVSAHLVVNGRFRVRNFDRLADEDGAMIIAPTKDYVADVGALSAMSSERDNIHWFVPQGGPATTFDVVISGLDVGMPSHEIQAVDPLAGQPRADGSIRAPVISFADSSARYTADV